MTNPNHSKNQARHLERTGKTTITLAVYKDDADAFQAYFERRKAEIDGRYTKAMAFKELMLNSMSQCPEISNNQLP